MNSKKIINNKSTIIIKSVIIGVLATVAVMLLLSAVMLFFDISNSFSAPFATVSVAVGSFLAAFYASRKAESRGYLVGLTVGVVAFLAVMLISLAVSKDSVGLNTLFHFIIIVVSSLIGGILGINVGNNKKYI